VDFGRCEHDRSAELQQFLPRFLLNTFVAIRIGSQFVVIILRDMPLLMSESNGRLSS
jgi:hypothetical protein